MQDIATLIAAIASAFWPVAILVILIILMPIVKSRLASGNVQFKMFGVEVSLQEASDNFGKQLADLQEKVAQLRQVAEQSHPHALETAAGDNALAPITRRILWVDDHPNNNVFEVGRLRSRGVTIDQVASTDEALSALTHGQYSTVITDMERREEGRTVPQAGIELIRQMRKNDISTPAVVYCSRRAVSLYAEKARALGASITSSPLELFESLELNE